MSNDQLVVVAVAAARAHGCDWDVEIRITDHDGITFAVAHHSGRCNIHHHITPTDVPTTRSTT
jgi:hypothetical protein